VVSRRRAGPARIKIAYNAWKVVNSSSSKLLQGSALYHRLSLSTHIVSSEVGFCCFESPEPSCRNYERHIRHSLSLHAAELPKWLHVSMLRLPGSTSFDDAAASFAQPCDERLVTTETNNDAGNTIPHRRRRHTPCLATLQSHRSPSPWSPYHR
jgi:hypothetical protein